ncbi:MAG: polysaccharide deacetylase family protein [Opitutales bacterium]
MKTLRLGKLKCAFRRLASSRIRGATILLYHRVAQVRPDPWGLCVSPENFAEHLEVLQRTGRPILHLTDLERKLRNGPLPRGAIVITFDDGYADNLYNAQPLLARYKTPATFFIATGCIDRHREFWWDELDRILLQPGNLPPKLSLILNQRRYEWNLRDDSAYSENDSRKHCTWTTGNEAPTRRHSLYRELWEHLANIDESEKDEIIDRLARWGNLPRTSRPSHASLTSDELQTLANNKHIEIGAHSVNHPMLASLTPLQQSKEIEDSKIFLEKLLNRPVRSFSYPHGNLSNETVSLVRDAHFNCACSTVADIVRKGSDPFQLPRIEVKNWGGGKFKRQLSLGRLPLV